jgi:nitronate monooxygenase
MPPVKRASFPATRLPVFAAPMFLLSGPDLVLAACRAGIVGAFPAPNARTPAILEEWMRLITESLASMRAQSPHTLIGPWCVNLVTHSTNTRLDQDLALVAKFKPPIVVTALGSPKPALPVVRDYGGIVIADVVNMKLAVKAMNAGVDGLACISAGAGGHTGFLSPFAFISAVRAQFDGLIIVGGGIADGTAAAGAIVAGADFVYMGTRFIATHESMAVDGYKQMVVDASIDDLIVSSAITGTAASWLKPSLRAAGLDPEQLPEAPPRNYDAAAGEARRWRDLWAAGQGVGLIRAVQPVAQVVDDIDREYRAAMRGAAARLKNVEAD